jgi:uncharacterized protein (UPF0276 family)
MEDDARRHRDDTPADHVGEIHLAGLADDGVGDCRRLLIDLAKIAWSLYRRALNCVGPAPTLIEWDNDVPPYPILAGEVVKARAALGAVAQRRNGRIAARSH